MLLLNFYFQKIFFCHAELEEKNTNIIQYLMSEESHVQNTLGSKNNIPKHFSTQVIVKNTLLFFRINSCSKLIFVEKEIKYDCQHLQNELSRQL